MSLKVKLLGIFIFLLLNSTLLSVSGYQISGNYTNTNGDIIGFDKFSNNLLVVDATATWCIACDAQLENLQTVYDTGVDAKILTISIDKSESVPQIIDLKAKFSSPWEFGLDQNGDFNDFYSVSYLPTLFLFDGDGEIIKKWEGITSPTDILNEINNNGGTVSLGEDVAESVYTDPGSILQNIFENPIFKMIVGLFIIGYIFAKTGPANPEIDLEKAKENLED